MSETPAVRPAMKVQVDGRPWVRVETFDEGEWDEHGLRRRGADTVSVPWSTVRRVAQCYRIHSVAIVDWDFWAFQTDDPLVTHWVLADLGSPFTREVNRRFDVGEVPPMAQWADRDFSIRAHVVWPPPDFGEPMYVVVKRRWWSWTQRLAYSKTSFSPRTAD